MHTIDFTTALGRLLRDGGRRDSFRVNASGTADELHLRAEDRAAFVTLSPAELEAQAVVLLRKRLDHVKRLAPELCAKLGGALWQRFQQYARNQWHEDHTRDALHFCEHVSRNDVRLVSRIELNRIQFLAGAAMIRIHLVRDLHFGGGKRSGIQILRRVRRGGFCETWLYPSL